MSVETYVSLILKLIIGIQAIQPARAPVAPERAATYAQAAAYHGLRLGLDPFDLIALARNESDFTDQLVGPDGLDCGLTQTRIIYSRYTCEQLRRSSWLAFAEAARELHAYTRSCQGRDDYDRCRFNRYNSGTRYARSGNAGRYYLRVTCFAEAARHGLPISGRCRDVRSREELDAWVRQAMEERGGDRLVAQAAGGGARPQLLVASMAWSRPGAVRPSLGLALPAAHDTIGPWPGLAAPDVADRQGRGRGTRWPRRGRGRRRRPQDMRRRAHSTCGGGSSWLAAARAATARWATRMRPMARIMRERLLRGSDSSPEQEGGFAVCPRRSMAYLLGASDPSLRNIRQGRPGRKGK
jgi:hypothetical protein